MGNDFLYGLLAAFVVYEIVMHFVFKNRSGEETLSTLINKLEKKRWWVRIIVGGLLAFGFYHFHVFF